ncbi:hypothetical protein FWG76_02345 [Candidatus Saccharibacteria bacterium]|nr:hypothetical protein [Candidatus Saccharibacteria bacterium]
MEIDFDALDQVISQKRTSSKSSAAAALKTPKYIDVIQGGAIKKPAAVRKSSTKSTVRKVKKVVTKKIEKQEKPVVNLAELIDQELETGDTTIGENLPQELNVEDLVAYAETTDIQADIERVSNQDAAEDFLGAKHELVPFLPNIKVEKTPLSGDVPERVSHKDESATKSERELASQKIEDDLVADKKELKEKEKQSREQEKEKEKSKARILTEERVPAKKARKYSEEGTKPMDAPKKKTSTALIVLLGILIAVFGAVAGAFIYLLTGN